MVSMKIHLFYKTLSVMTHQINFLLLVVICMMSSCSSITRNDTEEAINDTIVCKKKVQDHRDMYCTYEYFIINKGDTSSYSFICRSRRDYPHDCYIEILNWPRYKYYLIPKVTTISCYEPKYKDFLREMDLCLEVALNEKDSINLERIEFLLVGCTDIAIETSNLFYKAGVKDITHHNILNALQKTSLKEDFNAILKKYNLHIVDEHCCEEIYLVKKSDFLNVNEYHSKKEVPDTILDVTVSLNIVHT